MNGIDHLMEESGRELYASVFGASKMEPDMLEHKALIEGVVDILMDQNDFGVIHGAYDTGAMKLVSDRASDIIAKRKLHQAGNIGVPHAHFDHYKRVKGAVFTEPTTHICDRIKLISSGDIAVVCPIGSFGTLYEFVHVFHENFNRPHFGPGLDVDHQPLILVQSAQAIAAGKKARDWRALIEYNLDFFDDSQTGIKDYSWLHIVDSLHVFEEVIKELKPDLLSLKKLKINKA